MNKKNTTTKIAIFRKKEIRKTIYKNEWWFSVIDIIEALTGTKRSRKYWSDLKKKLTVEGYFEVSEKIGQLKLMAPDGKMRETDCGNTETIFRIIQSIPSPKVEPFKRWLAKNKRTTTFLNPCFNSGILAIIKLWAEEKYKKKMFALLPNLQTEEVTQ